MGAALRQLTCALQRPRVGERQLQLHRLPQRRRALAHAAQAAAHQRGGGTVEGERKGGV